jgi:quercetin dioxygenase-like cupin family protein
VTAGTRGDLHDDFTGQHLRFVRTGRDTGGALLQVEVSLEPGGWVPRHVHARQDERVTVLDGAIHIQVGRAQHLLRPGDVRDVPRRKLHVVRNADAGESRFLLEVRPARRMQGAMRGLFTVSVLLRPLARLRRSRALRPRVSRSGAARPAPAQSMKSGITSRAKASTCDRPAPGQPHTR